ncbi:MAG: phosphatidate cytidylyltransferase [Alphaproteobacteria bacterium]|nr:phosphatidate cytidylyltransferase [Alphaproteobacteria bacterium]
MVDKINFKKNQPLASSLNKRIISAIVLFIIFGNVFYLGELYFTVFLSILLGLAIGEWVAMVRNRRPALGGLARLGWNLLGCLVLVVAMGSLFFVNFSLPNWRFGGVFFESGFASLLWIFAQIWATDIAAFFVGRRLGGARLAPKISPNKTWSGAMGGASASALVSLVFVGLVHGWVLLPLLWALVIGLVVSVMAQLGDLLESAMKRYCQVKDSGRIIPGHGGVLDRIDGFLLVLPAMAVVSLWLDGSLLAWVAGR